MISVHMEAGDLSSAHERPDEALELKGILRAMHVRPHRPAGAGGGQSRGSVPALIVNRKAGDLSSSNGKYSDARVRR